MDAGWRSPGKVVNPDITNHIEFYIHDRKLPELKHFTHSQASNLIQFILEAYQGECRGIFGIPSDSYVFTPRLNEAEYLKKCLEVVDVDLQLGDNVHLIIKAFKKQCDGDIPF